MRPNPEPGKEVSLACGHGAMGTIDPNRPKCINFLEPQRGMEWVFKEQLILLGSLLLYFNRKGIETNSEPACGD
jgi:hypothetical protein